MDATLKTEEDISAAFCREYLKLNHSSERVYPNVFINHFEADLLCITKAGYVYEYEIKTNKADFNCDKNKSHRGISKYEQLLSGKRVNYFIYLCPPDLIKANEVPEWAGLSYMYGDFPCEIKAPKRLTSCKFPDIQKTAEKSIYYRFHMQRLKSKI